MPEDEALAALLDTLLPGEPPRWPSCTEAVPVAGMRAVLDAAMMQQVAMLAKGDQAEMTLRVTSFEREEPAAFAALLRAVTRAYYSAPRVQVAVRDLAEASPREASPLADPALVAGVLKRGMTRRRHDDAAG